MFAFYTIVYFHYIVNKELNTCCLWPLYAYWIHAWFPCDVCCL